jgi:hypothetical protein
VTARRIEGARRHVLGAAVCAGGAAAALASHAIHCDDDELAAAADESLELLLRASLAAIDAAGVLPGEDERGRLRVAIADYVEREEPEAGRCRICGCTETAACVGIPVREGHFANCSWADPSRTLCTNPLCLEKAGVLAPELVS